MSFMPQGVAVVGSAFQLSCPDVIHSQIRCQVPERGKGKGLCCKGKADSEEHCRELRKSLLSLDASC